MISAQTQVLEGRKETRTSTVSDKFSSLQLDYKDSKKLEPSQNGIILRRDSIECVNPLTCIWEIIERQSIERFAIHLKSKTPG